MLKHSLFTFLLACLACYGCNLTSPSSTTTADEKALTHFQGFTLHLSEEPRWACKGLRLYPITLNKEKQMAAAGIDPSLLLTTDEAMETPGFRITEKKDFGRTPQAWYNGLTVQNRTDRPVFLMGGDVVMGGNQDRVIAQDYIIEPRNLQNIEVFCVEKGRSSYHRPNAPEAEKEIAAFYGYHGVCSPSVRRGVYQKNQQGVWQAVSKVTEANRAVSSTSAYTALWQADDPGRAQREACVNALQKAFDGMPDVVGFVAVSNGKVIGAEVFRTSELFNRRLVALLKGLTADLAAPHHIAVPIAHSPTSVFRLVVQQQVEGEAAAGPRLGMTTYRGEWLHLYTK